MEIQRKWSMPNGKTFKMAPIKELVESYVSKLSNESTIVDPFANSSKYGTITNDLNPEYDTNFHMDALEFLKTIKDGTADIVLYDPPYSMRQATELYKAYGKEKLQVGVTSMKYWANCKDEIARIIKPGGACLSFGWNTNGIGKKRGFEIERILIVAHGGSRNDTLCVAERKVN